MSDALFVVLVIAGLALSFGLMVWSRSDPEADAAWDRLHAAMDDLGTTMQAEFVNRPVDWLQRRVRRQP